MATSARTLIRAIICAMIGIASLIHTIVKLSLLLRVDWYSSSIHNTCTVSGWLFVANMKEYQSIFKNPADHAERLIAEMKTSDELLEPAVEQLLARFLLR